RPCRWDGEGSVVTSGLLGSGVAPDVEGTTRLAFRRGLRPLLLDELLGVDVLVLEQRCTVLVACERIGGGAAVGAIRTTASAARWCAVHDHPAAARHQNARLAPVRTTRGGVALARPAHLLRTVGTTEPKSRG